MKRVSPKDGLLLPVNNETRITLEYYMNLMLKNDINYVNEK